MGMARPSLMDKQPELRPLVAEMYAAGESNQSIADEINKLFPDLDVHKDTITDYRRHPAVAPMISKILEERRNRITRKVDSALMARLDHADKVDTKTLLEIRKTIVGEKKINEDVPPEGQKSMTEQLFELADKDPEAAARIMKAQEAAKEN